MIISIMIIFFFWDSSLALSRQVLKINNPISLWKKIVLLSWKGVSGAEISVEDMDNGARDTTHLSMVVELLVLVFEKYTHALFLCIPIRAAHEPNLFEFVRVCSSFESNTNEREHFFSHSNEPNRTRTNTNEFFFISNRTRTNIKK